MRLELLKEVEQVSRRSGNPINLKRDDRLDLAFADFASQPLQHRPSRILPGPSCVDQNVRKRPTLRKSVALNAGLLRVQRDTFVSLTPARNSRIPVDFARTLVCHDPYLP